jgi:hypothetical protein
MSGGVQQRQGGSSAVTLSVQRDYVKRREHIIEIRDGNRVAIEAGKVRKRPECDLYAQGIIYQMLPLSNKRGTKRHHFAGTSIRTV